MINLNVFQAIQAINNPGQRLIIRNSQKSRLVRKGEEDFINWLNETKSLRVS